MRKRDKELKKGEEDLKQRDREILQRDAKVQTSIRNWRCTSEKMELNSLRAFNETKQRN
jgi:hypothetical protein